MQILGISSRCVDIKKVESDNVGRSKRIANEALHRRNCRKLTCVKLRGG